MALSEDPSPLRGMVVDLSTVGFLVVRNGKCVEFGLVLISWSGCVEFVEDVDDPKWYLFNNCATE